MQTWELLTTMVTLHWSLLLGVATRLLLDHRVDMAAAQNSGGTALMDAARGGHGAVAKLLLDHRADMAAADGDGNTALILAARCGHEAVAKLLLDHGADVAAADNHGNTALIFAAGRFFYRLMMRIKKFFLASFLARGVGSKKTPNKPLHKANGKRRKKEREQVGLDRHDRKGHGQRSAWNRVRPSIPLCPRCFATLSWWRMAASS